jgi:regulator of protease activity HflC (stomatin/prohibitin superfamily)
METNSPQVSSKTNRSKKTDSFIASRIILTLLILAIVSTFFVIIGAGERGVLMEFGQVKSTPLEEGLHFIIPILNTVEKLNVRVQKQEIASEASSKDLQDISIDLALNWHLIPQETPLVFQEVGNEIQVTDYIINPALEEAIKAIIAQYTAAEIITKRSQVKTEIDLVLSDRLKNYHVAVDDLSLVEIAFSKRFRNAVEAKQVAEQQAKQAEFIAQKAIKKAEEKVNLAKGEAEAHRILQASLTPEILQKQAIEKWNGNLPMIIGDKSQQFLDLGRFFKAPKP